MMRHDLGHAVEAAIVAKHPVADPDLGDRLATGAGDDPCRRRDAAWTPIVVQVGLVVLDRELHRYLRLGLNGHASPPAPRCRRRGPSTARARARPRSAAGRRT